MWDTKLASDAASWAQYLVTQGSMIHSGGSNGENLFQGWKDGSFAAAATMWAAEKSQYHGEVVPTDPNSNNFERWGHYTQVRLGALLNLTSLGSANIVKGHLAEDHESWDGHCTGL